MAEMPALLHFPQAARILHGFADSDCAGDSDTLHSISGYLFILNGAAVLWNKDTTI
jgi:hypothetical protein